MLDCVCQSICIAGHTVYLPCKEAKVMYLHCVFEYYTVEPLSELL